jgi:hypothetical protein
VEKIIGLDKSDARRHLHPWLRNTAVSTEFAVASQRYWIVKVVLYKAGTKLFGRNHILDCIFYL